jgi:hypothetical protein
LCIELIEVIIFGNLVGIKTLGIEVGINVDDTVGIEVRIPFLVDRLKESMYVGLLNKGNRC